MQFEGFNAVVQSTLSAMEQYFRDLTDSYSIREVIKDISDYGSSIKDEIAEQYNTLTGEMQKQYHEAFDEFMNKSTALIDSTIEVLKKNEIIVALSNDMFYNDDMVTTIR